MSKQQIERDEIIRIFGELNDHRVVEILETGANLEELEEASRKTRESARLRI